MRAVIIGNGSICNYDYIKEKLKDDDFIICADGGTRHAEAMGIIPDIVVGDFDSSKEYIGSNAIKYPIRKDFTDGEAAIDYAVQNGYDDILLLGMTGDRLDHMFTNIFMLEKCTRGCLVDDKNEVYLLKGRAEFCGKAGKTLSIVPVNGDLEGIVTEGLEYPLKNETLYFGGSRGISNVVICDRCVISSKKGTALIILNDGE